MSERKEMVSFYEDAEITRLIDVVALQEGSNRSAIIRRAIRKELIFLGAIPTNGNVPANMQPVMHEDTAH
jgi:hypothetical protein